jgi:hypothetical protein
MKTRSLSLVVIGGLLSGCAFNISPYGASINNVEAIKKHSGAKIAVANFTSSKPGLRAIACRGAGPVNTPNDQSFESYVRNAFVDELKLAGIYDPQSSAILSGRLDKVDFNSNIGAGKWVLSVTVSNGKSSYAVDSIYPFSTNWVADKACQQVAQAFEPAVQKLLGTLVSDPRFGALAAQEQQGAAAGM